jgi:ankyrin repeat protein
MRSLLARGADANARDADGNTVLMNWTDSTLSVSDSGRMRNMQLLLDHGADINARNNKGETALMLEVEANMEGMDNGIVRYLLQWGAQANKADNEGTTALMRVHNSESIARTLLEYGAFVDARDHEGRTALMHAVKSAGNSLDPNDSLKVAALLLRSGAAVNAHDKTGRTPLMHADTIETVRLLLQHGADLAARDFSGNTALHFAFQDESSLAFLLTRGADINAQNKDGETVLMRTVIEPIIYVNTTENATTLLIKRGANPNLRDRKGRTACTLAGQFIAYATLHTLDKAPHLEAAQRAALERAWRTYYLFVAVDDSKVTKVRHLLRAGANVNAVWADSTSYSDFGVFDGEPLIMAASNLTIFRLLLEHGADPNCKNTAPVGKGAFPLHNVALSGNLTWARLLLKHGANPNLRDEKGHTPLMDAVKFPKMVRLLLQHGATVNNKGEMAYDYDSHEWTDLMIAARYGQTESVRLMLARGARVNERNNEGDTALTNLFFYPCDPNEKAGLIATARLLLRAGANPNNANRNKVTPLIQAAFYGRDEAIPLLLARGAQVDAKDIRGCTALMYCAGGHVYRVVRGGNFMEPSPKIAALLLSSGANPNARNPQGETALIIAAKAEYLQWYSGYGGRSPIGGTGLRAAEKVTQLLLRAGADASARDKQGRTALDWAKAHGYSNLVRLLQQSASRKKAA